MPALARAVRWRLPQTLAHVLRSLVVTARSLDITPQAAVGLLRQLRDAGIVREATGRAAWRAFTVA